MRATETPAYTTQHTRLSKIKGKARNHDCVDCGGPALDWSYDGTDPNELIGTCNGLTMPFSTDPDRYVPRCRKCHMRHDKQQRVSASVLETRAA